MKSILTLLLFCIVPFAKAAEPVKTQMKVTPLSIREEWAAPSEEISGIKIWQNSLYLASDNTMDIYRYPWKSVESGPKRLDLSATDKNTLVLNPATGKKKKKKKQKKSQWEAISVDSEGSVFLLNEAKDELHVFAKDGKATKVFKLKSTEARKKDEKGFEGLLLLKSSHIIAALTEPPMLIEFGPEGEPALGLSGDSLLGDEEVFSLAKADTLHALQSWTLSSESGCEFADLAKEKNKVFALLKDCNRVIELPTLTAKQTEFSAVQSWTIPQSISHPEGLQSLGEEGFLVASDVRAIEKNVFWLIPAKANP